MLCASSAIYIVMVVQWAKCYGYAYNPDKEAEAKMDHISRVVTY